MLTGMHVYAQTLDLTTAKIFCPEKGNGVVMKAVAVLQEEIEKRSDVRLPVTNKWPGGQQSVIFVGRENDLPAEWRDALAQLGVAGSEGYKVLADVSRKAVVIAGHDERGVLYGVGKLLRKMEIGAGRVLAPSDLRVASTPAYKIRGHQLGYRPKTNSYDAFTVEMFDQYIRDLAIFGANSIEILPPRTDDKATSVNMKLPALQMMREQSRIADSYGMDVWIWYPNMGKNYEDSATVAAELAERREVFRTLPRIDQVFVPGGDPGHLDPDVMFRWLAREAELLHEYHPHARIWVSPQDTRPTQAWLDKFCNQVNKGYPWLGGVVYGPWIKPTIAAFRKMIRPEIPMRNYPDITHSIECQYPIPKWDLAYALTLGRECINPRPVDEKKIHNAFAGYFQGSISYSEGTNDDVNKIIWSDQDWDPRTPVIETLRDYARYFIGSGYTEQVAQGMMALERDLRGPLLANEGVMTTLRQWQAIEQKASAAALANPRLQMGLIRAYYDAYIYRRLIHETEQEQLARDALMNARRMGSRSAIGLARETLAKGRQVTVMPEWRSRCFALADSLYRSIGAQLTVEKHHGEPGRGNFMDYIDIPLNDAAWLQGSLSAIEKLPDEEGRLKAIDSILNWKNPGPGGFYDNFGATGSWDRVRSDMSWEEDPGGLQSPRVGYGWGLSDPAGGFQDQYPLSWMTQVATLHDEPLRIVYDNLDPHGSYTIRVSYTGRFKSTMKLTADGILVHDFIKTGVQPLYEFPVPAEALSDGVVEFTWVCEKGEIGPEVSEVWIIKK